jgi:hypothetical protein
MLEAEEVIKQLNVIQAIEPAAVATYNGAKGATEIAEFGSLAVKAIPTLTKAFVAVGGVLSIVDIIVTWRAEDSTVIQLRQLAKEREENLILLRADLEVLRNLE